MESITFHAFYCTLELCPLRRSRWTEEWRPSHRRGNCQIRRFPHRRSRNRIPAESNCPQDRNHHFPCEVEPPKRPAATRTPLPRAHRIHSTWADRHNRGLGQAQRIRERQSPDWRRLRRSRNSPRDTKQSPFSCGPDKSSRALCFPGAAESYRKTAPASLSIFECLLSNFVFLPSTFFFLHSPIRFLSSSF